MRIGGGRGRGSRSTYHCGLIACGSESTTIAVGLRNLAKSEVPFLGLVSRESRRRGLA
jgi:hypothetical protein